MYINTNEISLNGKINKNNYKDIYLRIVTEMPNISKEFDSKQVFDAILYNIEKTNIDFFHEFTRVDTARNCVFLSHTEF